MACRMPEVRNSSGYNAKDSTSITLEVPRDGNPNGLRKTLSNKSGSESTLKSKALVFPRSTLIDAEINSPSDTGSKVIKLKTGLLQTQNGRFMVKPRKVLLFFSPCFEMKRLCSEVLRMFQSSRVTRSTSEKTSNGNNIKDKIIFFTQYIRTN